MKGSGIMLDLVAYGRLVHGLNEVGDWEEAKRIFTKMVDQGIRPNVVVISGFGFMLFGVDVMATMMVGDLQVRQRVGDWVTVVSGSAVATVVAIFDGCNIGEDELLWCGDGVPVANSFLLLVGLISGYMDIKQEAS
ncbi:Hypothetical predicted protein [Olea europaea subsp. europaea]|uniref:Pentatricopeptide repeat-containing protein n=1 Tax=Olea europaea subsp. europaea TaxID=158383 RepID=A0A8S0PES3_OLEEU|nr:Hypothetical predicted protein [Olea europaea subsp. europaea]